MKVGDKTVKKLTDFTVNTRTKLTGLWTALMLLYIYCDIYSTFGTGFLVENMAARLGPFGVSQAALAIWGSLRIPAILMIAISLLAKARIVKWANIIAGVLYTFINIGIFISKTQVYYWLYGALELAITIIIIIFAVKWPKDENNNDL